MTLAERAQNRNNNFDLLRFLAASVVIFSHSFALVGAQDPVFRSLSGWDNYGSVALCALFVISGFLITRSWLDDPCWRSFALKRAARLYPGLIVAILVTVLLIGPLTTHDSLAYYLRDARTRRYLSNMFAVPAYYRLPGVFEGNPFSGVVNGSLWTLPVEVLMYLVVVVCGWLGLLHTRRLGCVIIALWFFAWHVSDSQTWNALLPQLLTSFHMPFVRCYLFFLAGTFAYLHREHIVLSGWTAGIAVAVIAASCRTPYVNLTMNVALPYLVLYLAYVDVPALRNFSRWGDASYGMYIYSFPLQQTIVCFAGERIGGVGLFASAYPLSVAVGYLSWHWVEAPVLRWARRRDAAPAPARASASPLAA